MGTAVPGVTRRRNHFRTIRIDDCVAGLVTDQEQGFAHALVDRYPACLAAALRIRRAFFFDAVFPPRTLPPGKWRANWITGHQLLRTDEFNVTLCRGTTT